MKKINDYPIGIKLSIPILMVVILISFVTIMVSTHFLNQNFNRKIQSNNKNKLDNTNVIIQILSEKALGIASAISDMELVKNAYDEFNKTGDLEKSRSMLVEEFAGITDKLTKELNLPAHIHFHVPPARSLLRCWDGTGGEDLSSFRGTILQVSENKEPLMGIEVDRSGIFIRGISPIFSTNGEFAGSVEYFFPFSEINQYLTSENYEIAFFIKEDPSPSKKSHSYKSDNIQRVKYHMIDSSSKNFNLNHVYDYLINNDISDIEMFKKNDYHYAMKFIYSFHNKAVGLIVYQEDLSDYKKTFVKSNTILIFFVSFLTFVNIISIILIIRMVVTYPLKLLSEVSKKHSLGDVEQEIDYYSKDEVGQLASAFRELQKNMLIVVNQAKTVSLGDYSTEIKPRSEKDELSISLNEMTKSLRHTALDNELQNKLIVAARNEVEKKAKDLAIASKYKSEFLVNMSHELRTPLNSLLILSRDLADNNNGNLIDKQVESAEIIYCSANDLLHLINEILDLSKIEAGKMTINVNKVLLEDLARNIKMTFHHQTKEKGIKLSVHIDDSLNKSIISDQQRIDQIIKNLLSNALKFTEKGSISVNFELPDPEINLSKSGLKHKQSIAISVKDTGIGIPEEKQEAIFEAFQQADGSTSRKYGGTGLGLSISRELANLLGGELQLQSREGKGTTFTIIIPQISKEIEEKNIIERRKCKDRRVKKEIPKIKESKNNKLALSIDDGRKNKAKKDKKRHKKDELFVGKRVLVVDDDMRNVFAVSHILEDQGMKIISAANGKKALDILEKDSSFNLVLMDIMMPIMDGYETIKRIRKQKTLKDLKIIALTANAMLGDKEKCLKAGANDYLAKPLQIDKLLSKMRDLINK